MQEIHVTKQWRCVILFYDNSGNSAEFQGPVDQTWTMRREFFFAKFFTALDYIASTTYSCTATSRDSNKFMLFNEITVAESINLSDKHAKREENYRRLSIVNKCKKNCWSHVIWNWVKKCVMTHNSLTSMSTAACFSRNSRENLKNRFIRKRLPLRHSWDFSISFNCWKWKIFSVFSHWKFFTNRKYLQALVHRTINLLITYVSFRLRRSPIFFIG